MQVLLIGAAILAFLIVAFLLLNFGHLIRFPKRKSAITDPPWVNGLDFTCAHCGHKDQATEAVVRCVKCRAIILKHPAELGALPQNTCDNRSPFLGGGD